MLACKLDVQGLLQQLQGCFVDAAASAQGLDRLCGVLTALRECSSSCREAVHEMLSAAVASALSQASQATLLPPLLVLQRLLHGSTDYSKVLEAAAVQALGPDSPNSEWAAPVVQDHVQLLEQLKKSVSAAVQHSVVDTLGTLEGAAHQLKQQQQQQQQGGTSSSIPPLSAGTLSTLEQFGQQARINGRRQLSDNHARSWGSAIQRRYLPEMCDAISLNVPGSAAEARLRWEFLMALQDCSLCSTVQVQQLVQTCAACGLDLNEGSAAAARQAAAAADPVDILQQLLDRLPVSFWAGYVCEVRHLGRWCAGPYGPFQRERLSSASTGAGSGSSSCAAGAADAAGKHNNSSSSSRMLGYLPRQMPALLRVLGQRLDDALVAEGLDQHDAAVLHECLQVCSKTLEKSKPLKWLVQQCGVA
ncbi:hypothetical protein OEZ85_001885 [Tetradesmus obliquus]|uniref:Uncharacterized protein n=1 Tax=Tetradesmus obliquus TaxID=3088 RepID=A0ABY8U180_TETOB|nr:hypothetical protein OEZ85_001885 [Tetradesmus obliquus]